LVPGTNRLHADNPAFDLTGPKVDVHVKRGELTLRSAKTPNLLPGDRLWIHPDLPKASPAHFVLIVAFLRGATNPPPPEWFTRVETWSVRPYEGVFVTVPAEAQQAVSSWRRRRAGLQHPAQSRARPARRLCSCRTGLAGGQFGPDAPGSLLTEVKVTSQSDPKALKERAELAARSLGIRLDQQCFDKPSDQQAPAWCSTPMDWFWTTRTPNRGWINWRRFDR